MAKTEKILIDNICPLHDLECEKAVLGTLTSPVLSNGEIPENLTEDCFYDEFLQLYPVEIIPNQSQ
mgnify:CR=1 FL=1